MAINQCGIFCGTGGTVPFLEVLSDKDFKTTQLDLDKSHVTYQTGQKARISLSDYVTEGEQTVGNKKRFRLRAKDSGYELPKGPATLTLCDKKGQEHQAPAEAYDNLQDVAQST